jgi:hypothetical protein
MVVQIDQPAHWRGIAMEERFSNFAVKFFGGIVEKIFYMFFAVIIGMAVIANTASALLSLVGGQ